MALKVASIIRLYYIPVNNIRVYSIHLYTIRVYSRIDYRVSSLYTTVCSHACNNTSNIGFHGNFLCCARFAILSTTIVAVKNRVD